MSLLKYFVLFKIFVIFTVTIFSAPSIVPRVSHGKNVNKRQWPSQVLILTGTNIGRVCGGSLINSEWVLTAAHCVRTEEDGVPHNPFEYKLVFGAYNRFRDKHLVYRNIVQIVNHPGYETQNHSFDVALLKMDKHVKFNDRVQPICLDVFPSTSPLNEDDIIGSKCYLTGFGKTSHYSSITSIPHILQQLEMKPFDHETCTLLHHEYYESEESKEEVTDKQICMVSVNQPLESHHYSLGGGCPGDSGGPLQCFFSNVWFQIGIAWSGTNCETHPTVFNLVYQYADFIIKEANYILPRYCKVTA